VVSWWFAPVPARRVEICRALTFGYAAIWLIVRARYVWDVADLPPRRYEPVGVMEWFGSPPSRPAVMCVWATGFVCSLVAAAGRAVRLTTPLAALSFLWIATLTSSFGQVFHTEHLVVLHLLVLAIATVLEPGDRGPTPSGTLRSGWPLNLMMSMVAVTYVAAGVAKLRFSGGDWLSGEVLRSWVAADNLRKVLLDDPASTLGGWLAGVAWVWAPIAAFTLLVELGAPVALVRGRARWAWLGAAWLFHVGIFALMAISFPYQLSGAASAAFLPLERIEARLRQRGKSGTPRSRWSSMPRASSAQSEAAGPISETDTGSPVASPMPDGRATTG
jgi:hypothetical protein